MGNDRTMIEKFDSKVHVFDFARSRSDKAGDRRPFSIITLRIKTAPPASVLERHFAS